MCLFQIEDIRSSIDKIDENVAEVKKLYSVILSAPTSDQSKIPKIPLPVFLPVPALLPLFMQMYLPQPTH